MSVSKNDFVSYVAFAVAEGEASAGRRRNRTSGATRRLYADYHPASKVTHDSGGPQKRHYGPRSSPWVAASRSRAKSRRSRASTLPASRLRGASVLARRPSQGTSARGLSHPSPSPVRMLSDRTRSPSAGPRLAVRSPGATRTPPHRGLNPPSVPDDGAPPAIDGSPRRAGSELQVNVPLALQVEPAHPKPKGTCDVSADAGDPLKLQRVASSSTAAALQSFQQPPPLPRVETSSGPSSRPSTPPPEDRWLLPFQVDAKLWPGAHAAGWSVMVRSKQSGHYWYISPRCAAPAPRSSAPAPPTQPTPYASPATPPRRLCRRRSAA